MLRRKKPDPNYKPEEEYTWPMMARKIAQWKKKAPYPKTQTESYRVEIINIGDGPEKKKSASWNGAQELE